MPAGLATSCKPMVNLLIFAKSYLVFSGRSPMAKLVTKSPKVIWVTLATVTSVSMVKLKSTHSPKGAVAIGVQLLPWK